MDSVTFQPDALFIESTIEVQKPFNPTRALHPTWIRACYIMWEKAAPGRFKSECAEMLSEQEEVMKCLADQDLLVDYFCYALEHAFEKGFDPEKHLAG